MLRNIPDCISPDLLKVLHEMGHGDRIVIGDVNFPAKSISGDGINIRCDGIRATELVRAILELMPLDDFVEKPVMIMDKMDIHQSLATPVWDEFRELVKTNGEKHGQNHGIEMVDRSRFYEIAKQSYAVVSTTEKAFYACIILQKGCL